MAFVMVVETANQEGHSLSFEEHLRLGLPLTLMILGIAYFGLTGSGFA